jgi:RimJ/RimL family protein N-acetyltransferase
LEWCIKNTLRRTSKGREKTILLFQGIMKQVIITNRLRLINSSEEILEKALSGDDALSKHLDITIPESWTEFGASPFQYALSRIKNKPEDSVWWSWLPILDAENILIGNCGYKGPPKDGMVEIGYEVAKLYRQQGFATEIALALIKNAFSHEPVHMVIAHTLAEENASVKVLRKCGFQFAEEIDDPEDGLIWKWILKK